MLKKGYLDFFGITANFKPRALKILMTEENEGRLSQ